jgi:hypothetical protein
MIVPSIAPSWGTLWTQQTPGRDNNLRLSISTRRAARFCNPFILALLILAPLGQIRSPQLLHSSFTIFLPTGSTGIDLWLRLMKTSIPPMISLNPISTFHFWKRVYLKVPLLQWFPSCVVLRLCPPTPANIQREVRYPGAYIDGHYISGGVSSG